MQLIHWRVLKLKSRAGLMPMLQGSHAGPNDGDEEADHGGAKIRAGRHFVVLLGDGEDSEDKEANEDDLVTKRAHRRV